MTMLSRLLSWTKALLARPRLEREMDAELQFHLEAYAEDLMRGGLTAPEAMRRARVAFGGVEARKEECRASLGLRLWDELRSDLVYAARMLRQSPGFTAVAVTSLALGVGANTAIFSMMEQVLLTNLQVSHPEELRVLSWTGPDPNVIYDVWGNYTKTASGRHTSTSFSHPIFQRLRQQNKVFQDLFAFKELYRLTVTANGNAEEASGQLVSGDFYRDLGVETGVGRAILPSDDTRGSPPVAVISDAYWTKRFGRSIGTIGKAVNVNDTPVTIIGVNTPSFRGAKHGESPDFFLPLVLQPRMAPPSLLEDNNEFWVLIMGRLKPGVTDAQAESALDVAFVQDIKETLPTHKGNIPKIKLLTGSRGLDTLREHYSKPIGVLLSMSGVVLLLACVNLANLLLARASAREREISIRAALGAGRARIVRQVFTESLLLAGCGGAAGTLLGYWCRNLIPGLTHSRWDPPSVESRFDVRVLLFSIALCLATGIVFGLAPAWHATRQQVSSGLKETSRTTTSRAKALAGRLLVTFQVSLSVLLVIGAGLFVRTLMNLRSTNIGFEPQHVLLFSLDPPHSRYSAAGRIPFFHQVEEKLAAVPGVSHVAVSSDALLANNMSTSGFTPEGVPKVPSQPSDAWVNAVSTQFFATMGIHILRGRAFDAHDSAKSQPVAIIDELLAKRYYPNTDPIGRMCQNNNVHVRIVGVCAKAKFADLRSDPPPTFYRPYLQEDGVSSMTYELKTTANVASMASAIRQAVRQVDGGVPVTDIRTQTEQIDATLNQERLFAALTTSFGVLALILASIGVYGIMAYTVARRTNEIGVRMALGAQSGQVLRSVLRESAWLGVAGLIVGVAAALGLTRGVSSLLYGLKPQDPLTIGLAVALLFSVTLLAAWMPARRASRVDPLQALRHE